MLEDSEEVTLGEGLLLGKEILLELRGCGAAGLYLAGRLLRESTELSDPTEEPEGRERVMIREFMRMCIVSVRRADEYRVGLLECL